MRTRAGGVAVLFGSLLLLAAPPGALAQTTTRMSVSSVGAPANGHSSSWPWWGYPSISADGRCVAFYSAASNLVPSDANDVIDVFVHDRQTGQTQRTSVASTGTEGNGYSNHPALSADGRFVAFESSASNLVPGDTDDFPDIFVHDRQSGQTTRVSIAAMGGHANSGSGAPSISADGRFVAFGSWASNLVPDDTNEFFDVFVHDRQTSQQTRVSVTAMGAEGNESSYGPCISADGRFVVFGSLASNLVEGDTNDEADVFVHDRQAGQTSRVSVASDGTQGNNFSGFFGVAISADGRFVAFDSYASNLVPGDSNLSSDIFVHDRETGQTSRVSVASDGTQGIYGGDGGPTISADGRFVAFDSSASNLVPGDSNDASDIFVHDRQTRETTLVSISSSVIQGNADSVWPSISASGRFLAFVSLATNFVPGDDFDTFDVFAHDRAMPCPGDANGDGVTDFIDLNTVLSAFGSAAGEPSFLTIADMNQDAHIDFLDLNIVLSAFGTAC